MTIFDVMKDSFYKTEQFSNEAINNLNAKLTEKEDKNGKKYAVVNNTDREQITVFYDINGNSKQLTVGGGEIVWIKE